MNDHMVPKVCGTRGFYGERGDAEWAPARTHPERAWQDVFESCSVSIIVCSPRFEMCAHHTIISFYCYAGVPCDELGGYVERIAALGSEQSITGRVLLAMKSFIAHAP